MADAYAVFRSKAPQIMRNMIRDLSLSAEDAAAILGNFGVETGGFTLRLEKGKTTRESTGFGWAQWTGSRRNDFERWCAANGHKPNGNDNEYDLACYAFFVHEITNTWEKRAVPALKAAQGIEAKTLSFMKTYERPGVPHQERRIAMAKMALETYGGIGVPEPTTPARPITPMPSIVPVEWMPSAKMQRIIVHWTAGAHRASSLDRQHYHLLIEGDGKLIQGTHSIKENEAPIVGTYAAHTLNCNSGSIGISVCAMMGAVEQPFKPGPAPITPVQWTAMIKVAGALAQHYNISVTPKTILSHAEVQGNLGIAQRGKWDIARIPFDPTVVGAKACGDKMRAEVRAEMGAAPVAKPVTKEIAVGTGGAVVVGTGVAVAVQHGIAWSTIIPIAIIVLAIVMAAVVIIRRQ